MSDSSDTYVEKRVSVRRYGTIGRSSKLLVPVPGITNWQNPKDVTHRLHVLAAKAMTQMAEAIKRDLDIELKLASAWRPHRWKSLEHYEATIRKRFPKGDGRKWLAYNSPHETGLAMDIGVGGLWPSKSTRKAQRKQPLHAWLVEHAYEYGWHPYKAEPWHWEYPVSLEAFSSGQIGPDDTGPPEEMVSFGHNEDEEVIEAEDIAEFSDDVEDAPTS
ncbi:MAG: D-alanyl-D-alanine carboxypeptidase family protein [Myxococcota bacterium]